MPWYLEVLVWAAGIYLILGLLWSLWVAIRDYEPRDVHGWRLTVLRIKLVATLTFAWGYVFYKTLRALKLSYKQ